MKNKLILPFLMCAAILAAPDTTMADELISDTTVRRLDRDSDNLPLLRVLDLDRRNGVRINSVIVVALSRAGRGSLSLVMNGQNVATRDVGRDLEVIQIPLNRTLGRDIRSLQLDPRGNIVVSMVGVTVEDTNYGPVPPPSRPQPPHRPVPPPHRPEPRAECKLTLAQVIDFRTYKYVLKNLQNEVMAKSTSLDGIIKELETLQRNGVCRAIEQQELSITGAVTIDFRTYKNGLKLSASETISLGYNYVDDLLSEATKLVSAGFGYISSRQQRCEIGGSRVVDFRSYNYSLSQGDQLIDYNNDINAVGNTKNKLTEAGFCPRY